MSRLGVSGIGIFADLAEGGGDGQTHPASRHWAEVGCEARSGLSDLFDRDDYPGFTHTAGVAVISEGDAPGDSLSFVIVGGMIFKGFVNGSSHASTMPRIRRVG